MGGRGGGGFRGWVGGSCYKYFLALTTPKLNCPGQQEITWGNTIFSLGMPNVKIAKCLNIFYIFWGLIYDRGNLYLGEERRHKFVVSLPIGQQLFEGVVNSVRPSDTYMHQ